VHVKSELIQKGRSATRPMIKALRDRSEFVSRTAAEVLGAATDVRAVEPLIVSLTDQQVDLRAAAATLSRPW